MVSALLKCKNAIKRALKSKAMLGRDLVAEEFEVCTRDTNGEGNAVVLLSVCPLTTADTLLCFLSVCFSASPLNFLHHPGCFPERRLSVSFARWSPPTALVHRH